MCGAVRGSETRSNTSWGLGAIPDSDTNRPDGPDEAVLVRTLRCLDADLAFLLGAVTGSRIEDELRPIAERVRTNEAALMDILQT